MFVESMWFLCLNSLALSSVNLIAANMFGIFCSSFHLSNHSFEGNQVSFQVSSTMISSNFTSSLLNSLTSSQGVRRTYEWSISITCCSCSSLGCTFSMSYSYVSIYCKVSSDSSFYGGVNGWTSSLFSSSYNSFWCYSWVIISSTEGLFEISSSYEFSY